MNRVDVSRHVRRSGKRLVADVALVLGVLVLRFRVNSQAGLRLVTFATVPTFVGSLLGVVAACDFAALLVDLLDVPLQTRLLRETALTERANEERVLVLLLHVTVEGGLGGEDLVAKLAGEALADVVVEALDVREEVVLLQEQFVADETLEGLPVVRSGEVKFQLRRRPEHDVAFSAPL